MAEISSAEPEQLYRYAACALELDNTLQSEGRSLAETLRYFERQCKEPGFTVTGSALGDDLCTYGGSAESPDEHVREVGLRFARADGQSLGSRVWMSVTDKWEKMKTVVTSTLASVSITIGQILNIPHWLASKLRNVSWIRDKNESTNVESKLGRLAQEQNTKSSEGLDKDQQKDSGQLPKSIKDATQSAQVDITATTKDCVAFVKAQSNRKVPSGFNSSEFYSGKYKGKSGKLSDGTEYGQEPKAGAIMVESPNDDASINYGHASYVYEVYYDADGKVTSYKIAEGNWGQWGEDGTPPPVHYEEFSWDSESNSYTSKSGKRSPDMFIL